MTGDAKGQWEKPELEVLVRSCEDEAVLMYCKDEAGGHSGPSFSDRLCNGTTPGCPNCSAWAPS